MFGIGKARTTPYSDEIQVRNAEPGMYITKNSVYVVNQVKDNTMTVIKNGRKVFADDYVYLRSLRDINQLDFGINKGGSTTIIKYLKQIDKETFFKGFYQIAQTLINKGHSLEPYLAEVKELFQDKNYTLSKLSNKEVIEQCPLYKIYNQGQYGAASLYIEAARTLGETYFKAFLQDKRIKDVLYDMSFDHNGLASLVELKAQEKKEEGKTR